MTSTSSGAVEVVATTANGLKARKLLLIQKAGFVLADDITMKNELPNHMRIVRENRVQIASDF